MQMVVSRVWIFKGNPNGIASHSPTVAVLGYPGLLDSSVQCAMKNMGDLVPSHGANVVVQFHRAHGVSFGWSIVPPCGKKLLISNSGM